MNVLQFVLCCALLKVCLGRFIHKAEEPRMKCTEIGPGLQGAFGYHCFMPTSMTNSSAYDMKPTWTFNGEPIADSEKYHMGVRQYESYYDGKMVDLFEMYLVIMDIGADDIGEYGMGVTVENQLMEGMQESMMLSAALACPNHPTCYEDNCKWPEKLICKSNPEAYCQMDMCENGFLCMPKWFVGAKQVECEEVEGIPYHMP